MHVFHDPSGRRSARVRFIATCVTAVAVLLGGSFAAGVWLPPPMELLPIGRNAELADAGSLRLEAPRGPAASRCVQSRLATCLPIRRGQQLGTPAADPIVAAFAVQWDPASRASLERIGDRLDWVIIEGAFLGRAAPGAVTVTLDPDLLDVAQRQSVQPHLMLTNFGASKFEPALVDALVKNPAHRRQAVATLVEAVERLHLGGIVIDFELVNDPSHPAVLTFVRALRAALAPLGAVVSTAVPASKDDHYPIAEYAAAADYLMPMLYDEHASIGGAGAVAGEPWFVAQLDSFARQVPGARLIPGIGQYGYHWRSDRPVGLTVSASEGAAFARTADGGPWFDERERNPYATWRDAAGVQHQVWYLDAITGWNQIRTAFASGAAGIAIWRLGTEDATLWRVVSRTGLTGSPRDLRVLPADGVSVLSGDGEVMSVERQAGDGERSLVVTPQGDILRERVTRAPGGYRVERAGAHRPQGTRVALTFDDGPDPAYTGAILDTLAHRGAVASFFVIGREVARHPAIARRIVRDGHEIGNHTYGHPDLGGLTEGAIHVEIAAAGRVIEAVTGRRPRLFRPPYIGDARPATIERLRPMAVATTLGLWTAGLEVDTHDWQLTDPARIVRQALDGLQNGRVILLHDAGGDRAPTVAAIGPLVDSLRRRGYELTTVAGLLDAPSGLALPLIPSSEWPHRVLDGISLAIAGALQWLLVGIFTIALALSIARLVVIGVLASVERWRRARMRAAQPPSLLPSVTVVVPGYNEERVIARTVQSLLDQQYPGLEILVVDDGSTDATAAEALRVASPHARVRVLQQANRGKAAALTAGFAQAQGSVVVVVDADTVLAPDAIRRLVIPMADPRVGAVAGNAKVGNRVNIVTRWQAVEYITSQNFDRRAFALLNSITVVPGAIGAWRRDAVLHAGGFRGETLAEDQDLTITLLRQGFRVAFADDAIAYTEAPETLGALGRQRFRWSFGTLQCAWKHRHALTQRNAGAIGRVGLPNIILFQLLFPLLAPAADLALIATLTRLAIEAPALGQHAAWSHAVPVVSLYAVFLAVDFLTALVGLAFERGESLAPALLAPLQRIAYRQMLYIALVRAVIAALRGWSPTWGKLERTGHTLGPVTTAAPSSPVPAAA